MKKKLKKKFEEMLDQEIDISSCSEVGENEIKEMAEFAKNLVIFCAKAGGVGISACQVGVNKKLFVWLDKPNVFQVAVNACYIPEKNKKINMIEGCLSYPGEYYYVERYKRIRAIYFTFNKEKNKLVKITRNLQRNSSVIFVHECQHQEGITIAMIGKFIEKRNAKKNE